MKEETFNERTRVTEASGTMAGPDVTSGLWLAIIKTESINPALCDIYS